MRRFRALATLGGFGTAVAVLATATAHATTPTPTSPPALVVQAIPNPAREAQRVTLTANRTHLGSTPHWSQVEGPSVRLQGADTLEATFVAPSVARATTLVFRFSMPPFATSLDVEVLVLSTNAVIVTIPDTEGAPAGFAEVGVVLDPVGLEVTELHHRLGFTAAAAVADRGDGTPDCSVAADFDTATFAFLPQGCGARHACTQVRADVGFTPTRTTAREAYRCRIAVSPLPADTCQHPLACAGGTAESRAGSPLQLTCGDGTVTSRYEYLEPIFTLRTEPAPPQVGADVLLVFTIDQLVGGLARYSLDGLWPLIESVSTVPDTGTPGEVAYTVRPVLAGTAYPHLGVHYEVTGGCPGNEFFFFEFAHSQDFPVPIQDPRGVRVSGRVAELPGCDGAAVGREVQMEPGRYVAHSDRAAGEFSFAGVSPGDYAIGVRPTCNDFGCWPDLSVHVGREDVFIMLCPKTLACTGDCNGDHRVTIDELIRGVGMALDMIAPAATCGSLDIDASGQVQINELITAVNAALDGCFFEVNNTTPTPTPAAVP